VSIAQFWISKIYFWEKLEKETDLHTDRKNQSEIGSVVKIGGAKFWKSRKWKQAAELSNYEK